MQKSGLIVAKKAASTGPQITITQYYMKIVLQIDKQDPSYKIIPRYKNFDKFISNYEAFHSPSGFRRLIRKDMG